MDCDIPFIISKDDKITIVLEEEEEGHHCSAGP